MVSSLYKEDIYDAFIAGMACDYISRRSSYKEIKDNIYKILEFVYDPDEIENFSEADWNLVEEVINEWCN